MLEALSSKLARSIKNANPEETASIEVLNYAINIVLNPLAIFLLASAAGLLIGKFQEVLLFLVFFPMLKVFSGGRHLKSSSYCVLLTTAVAVAVSFADFPALWNHILTGISLLLVLLFAPFSTKKTTLIPEKYNPLLKIISALVVCSNFFIGSSVIGAAFFLQAVSLINFRKGGGEQ